MIADSRHVRAVWPCRQSSPLQSCRASKYDIGICLKPWAQLDARCAGYRRSAAEWPKKSSHASRSLRSAPDLTTRGIRSVCILKGSRGYE